MAGTWTGSWSASGEAVEKVEVATAAVGARGEQGMNETATALGESQPVERLEKAAEARVEGHRQAGRQGQEGGEAQGERKEGSQEDGHARGHDSHNKSQARHCQEDRQQTSDHYQEDRVP